MKNDILVNVPKGTRYISEWKELDSYLSLDYPFIFNKVVTGCGATTYYLLNNENVVLLSPRIELIRSKITQDKFDGVLSLLKFKVDNNKKVSNKAILNLFEQELINHIKENKPIKIIVTYDSFKDIKPLLQKFSLIDKFRFVVDEFQALVKDSSFKGSVELEFTKLLEGLNKVVYLSATPLPDFVCNQITVLKDLPTVKLCFDKEDLRIVNFNGLLIQEGQTFASIIRDYYDDFKRMGYFYSKNIGDVTYYCRELVIFCSNVREIGHIININHLTKDEVDVICSEESKNKLKKICGINASHIRGINEPKKIFTFVTKVSFEGADFWSDNAATIIFSQPSVKSMVVDISSDLLQIIGRQRLSKNKFKNDIYLYTYNCSCDESYEELKQKKMEFTIKQLNYYNGLNDWEQRQQRKQFKANKFESYYIEVVGDKPIISSLYMICEEYCEQIRKDLVNNKQFFCLRDFTEADVFNIANDEEIALKNSFLKNYGQTNRFENRLKLVCDLLDNQPNILRMIEGDLRIDPIFIEYYKLLGSKQCKAKNYRLDYLEPLIKEVKSKNKIKQELGKLIQVGETNTIKYYKNLVGQVYNQLGINLKAKASDLAEYYELQKVSIYNEGKRIWQYKVVNGR